MHTLFARSVERKIMDEKEELKFLMREIHRLTAEGKIPATLTLEEKRDYIHGNINIDRPDDDQISKAFVDSVVVK